MSDPDSTPHRRPPTIDLTAKEVDTEPNGSAADRSAAGGGANHPAGAGPAAGGRTSRATAYLIGVVAGAVAVVAIIAGLWIAGFMPREAAMQSVQAARSPAPDEVSSRLDKIQQALQTPHPDAALTGRMTAAEVQAKSSADSLAALTHRVDEIAAASQTALSQARAAASAAEEAKRAAQASVQRDDLDALTNRIAALESAIKSLTAEVGQRASRADDNAARATVAAEALRAAVERGVPYQAELDAVKSFGADGDAIEALAPFAAGGVPSAAALGRELAAIVPALQRASDVPAAGGSFFGRLEAHAQKLVRITPIDAKAAPAGDDASSALARINADAANADIAAALADIARLPSSARPLAENWVKKAQAREAALAASRRIAADALAALGKPAPR